MQRRIFRTAALWLVTVLLVSLPVACGGVPPNGGHTTGWAVGDAGVTLRLDAGVWSTVATPTGNDLYDITLVSDGEAWAVGEQGVILHWGDLSRWASHSYLPYLSR